MKVMSGIEKRSYLSQTKSYRLYTALLQKEDIFSSLAVFVPKHFEDMLKNPITAGDHEKQISAFCLSYKIDPVECSKELFGFATTFEKLRNIGTSLNNEPEGRNDYGNHYEDEIDDNEDGDSSCILYYQDALNLLADKKYHLIDAHPLLYKAVPIPISSCSAERSLSVLKRIKSRLRATMLQDRLEPLLHMAIEKHILTSLETNAIINKLGKSSLELSKMLLFIICIHINL